MGPPRTRLQAFAPSNARSARSPPAPRGAASGTPGRGPCERGGTKPPARGIANAAGSAGPSLGSGTPGASDPWARDTLLEEGDVGSAGRPEIRNAPRPPRGVEDALAPKSAARRSSLQATGAPSEPPAKELAPDRLAPNPPRAVPGKLARRGETAGAADPGKAGSEKESSGSRGTSGVPKDPIELGSLGPSKALANRNDGSEGNRPSAASEPSGITPRTRAGGSAAPRRCALSSEKLAATWGGASEGARKGANEAPDGAILPWSPPRAPRSSDGHDEIPPPIASARPRSPSEKGAANPPADGDANAFARSAGSDRPDAEIEPGADGIPGKRGSEGRPPAELAERFVNAPRSARLAPGVAKNAASEARSRPSKEPGPAVEGDPAEGRFSSTGRNRPKASRPQGAPRPSAGPRPSGRPSGPSEPGPKCPVGDAAPAPVKENPPPGKVGARRIPAPGKSREEAGASNLGALVGKRIAEPRLSSRGRANASRKTPWIGPSVGSEPPCQLRGRSVRVGAPSPGRGASKCLPSSAKTGECEAAPRKAASGECGAEPRKLMSSDGPRPGEKPATGSNLGERPRAKSSHPGRVAAAPDQRGAAKPSARGMTPGDPGTADEENARPSPPAGGRPAAFQALAGRPVKPGEPVKPKNDEENPPSAGPSERPRSSAPGNAGNGRHAPPSEAEDPAPGDAARNPGNE